MAVLHTAGNRQRNAKEDAAAVFERLVVLLEKKGRTFDFSATTQIGKCVFVGEGDLSFARALARDPKSCALNITATTFEAERSVCPAGRTKA